MTTLIDYILDLFRSPDVAAAFVTNPEQAMREAGVPTVTAAQLQAVAATAVPAGVALGGGNPVVGLQRAVADHHSIASPFSPQTSFASQPIFAPETEVASRNNTNAEFLSPDQSAGANAQSGAFNLGFGDITLGDKTSNTATNGGVVVDGDNDGDIVSGDGAVLGDGNSVNNGDILAGAGSNVAVGQDNEIEDNSQTAGGDLISGNDGPVISDVDMSGGHGGGASGGGDSLLGIGFGSGNAVGGDGGSGGSIIIADNDTSSVGGNQTSVGGDFGSGNTEDNSVSTAVESETESTTTVSDYSTTDSSVHSSVDDNSVHQAGGFNSNFAPDTTTSTDLDSTIDTGLDAF